MEYYLYDNVCQYFDFLGQNGTKTEVELSGTVRKNKDWLEKGKRYQHLN